LSCVVQEVTDSKLVSWKIHSFIHSFIQSLLDIRQNADEITIQYMHNIIHDI